MPSSSGRGQGDVRTNGSMPVDHMTLTLSPNSAPPVKYLAEGLGPKNKTQTQISGTVSGKTKEKPGLGTTGLGGNKRCTTKTKFGTRP
jgi:hypothetical protein